MTVTSTRELLTQLKSAIREVEPYEVEARLDEFTLLDVREPDEYAQGALPGAVHLPRGNLEFQVDGRLPDKSQPIVVYCAGGGRSAFAAKTLADLGYADVVSMAGGFNKWKDEGREWRKPATLSPEQRTRYQRPHLGQLTLSGVFDQKVGKEGADVQPARSRRAANGSPAGMAPETGDEGELQRDAGPVGAIPFGSMVALRERPGPSRAWAHLRR
jgi:rhodanese-related sulfurtransferase